MRLVLTFDVIIEGKRREPGGKEKAAGTETHSRKGHAQWVLLVGQPGETCKYKNRPPGGRWKGADGGAESPKKVDIDQWEGKRRRKGREKKTGSIAGESSTW